MTLFSIARKNIKRNFYNYFLYFASMIFSIVIFFTFVSLQYNDQIVKATTMKVDGAFKAASVALIIFVSIFIWYSNAFFTRKRKKEVGLYSLLGVKKKQIGLMLFYENFVMGILALVIGVILGALLSKFFVMLLMKLVGAAAVDVHFMISGKAIIETVIVFAIVILITSFEGYRLIYRFKLIELFQAEKKGESTPKASIFAAIFAVILIGFGYWLALDMSLGIWSNFLFTVFLILAAVVIGTYLFFRSLSVYLLKLSKKNKRYYYNGINIIGTSQLLYRIRGNARVLTVIAILSAVTLCAFGTSYSLYYTNKKSVETQYPFSFAYISQGPALDHKVNEILDQAKDHKVTNTVSVPALKFEADLPDMDNPPSQYFMDLRRVTLMPQSEFNKLAGELGIDDKIHLKGNHAIALDNEYNANYSPKYKGEHAIIHSKPNKATLEFIGFKEFNLLNREVGGLTVVVNDQLFNQLSKANPVANIKEINVTNAADAGQLSNKLADILPEKAKFSDFYKAYKGAMSASGIMIFMGAFLGLVFVLATGSIIYFKQLTEATADKDRYDILRKIGVSNKEIKGSIAKQILFIFALPLILGILHSAFALASLSKLLGQNIVIPVLISMGVYTLIYIIYYFLTVNSYDKIVKAKKRI
ncbi:putative ABC transport system permease protein [Scopulibacillus daqui]|uniref:ABC transport system permease protein n=1 Tax=Scopulibacillus daqui TaxID=1469162 RepID=A0ABS2Q183_9BACL|nr:putative ABC transport system permease protein [Scopulibacillus daqui]